MLRIEALLLARRADDDKVAELRHLPLFHRRQLLPPRANHNQRPHALVVRAQLPGRGERTEEMGGREEGRAQAGRKERSRWGEEEEKEGESGGGQRGREEKCVKSCKAQSPHTAYNLKQQKTHHSTQNPTPSQIAQP
eukprot:776142-Rhodomonas_salina.3